MNQHACVKYLIVVLIVLAGGLCCCTAGAVEPLSDPELALWQKAQNVPLQNMLSLVFPERDGYQVTGPLLPTLDGSTRGDSLYRAVRVLCSNLAALEAAVTLLEQSDSIQVLKVDRFIKDASPDALPGFRGLMAHVVFRDTPTVIIATTIQQTRFMLWNRLHRDKVYPQVVETMLAAYAVAVSDYLYALDRGESPELPDVLAYELDPSIDIMAEAPDYVIQGYENYKTFLRSHADIHVDFGTGLLGFIPSDSLRMAITLGAPRAAFWNKEAPKIQEELHTFTERGGGLEMMRTLTAEVFDTLSGGEYFFAVGMSGRIRFGRELLREEVARIESETGQKPARGNHAFLFLGEPILTAGAFFIENDEGKASLVEINGQSGHYFYSNVSESIREDIAERSDTYLLTLGHFFGALDSIGVACDNVLVRKF